MKKTIQDLYDMKSKPGGSMVLFTNAKGVGYPLHYNGSNGKKHQGFTNDAYANIRGLLVGRMRLIPETLNDMFGRMDVYNGFAGHHQDDEDEDDEENQEENPAETSVQSGGGGGGGGGQQRSPPVQTQQDREDEAYHYTKRWEELFSLVGIMPTDCPCKEYSRALYKRCVLDGKPRRGLRPIHKEGCSKELSRV